jgi:hypothetical protein
VCNVSHLGPKRLSTVDTPCGSGGNGGGMRLGCLSKRSPPRRGGGYEHARVDIPSQM